MSGPFRRVLIANRGEIACRIAATCRRLGIQTVAVYSDADRGAAHVAVADQAVRIGPAAAAASYLDGAAILAAARATGADAVHPGYGFLSENPGFVDAVAAAGLTFIGPSAAAIRAMGLKDAAKRLMAEAGVPVVPGYHGADQDDALLGDEAARIGWPVLIKAVAGGGGKGMRRVDDAGGFAAALNAARSEARGAFGNDAVLIEKYVTTPRHIEMQVFGDRHGNVVHLFERDCSLQRRHQKVIEEAPAPGMTPEMRAAMGAAAVRAARAIDYAGAGTVEFIVDGAHGLHPDRFWFMEMNTRLQVEHPVTEAITGLDLVEWQLRVAAGEPLPLRQDDLGIEGHAFEARIYAEDPARGFLPAIGRIEHLTFPADVRTDAGVRAGDTVGPHYDPMIAKVIAHGPTRHVALHRLAAALDATRIAGTTTNVGFLARLARDPGLNAGTVDTGLIERRLDALTTPAVAGPDLRAVAALAALDLLDGQGPLAGFALWSPLTWTVRVDLAGEEVRSEVEMLGAGSFRVDGRAVEIVTREAIRVDAVVDGRWCRMDLVPTSAGVTLFDGAEAWVLRRPDPFGGPGAAHPASDEIRAPMPGLVKHLAVQAGAHVARGEVLVVLEAMKMEHALTAPRDGIVARVAVADGAQVVDGALLLALEPADG